MDYGTLEFGLATADEICKELGARLKAVRLSKGLRQEEVTARAGISRRTLVTLEGSGHCTLPTLVRVVYVLGLEGELQDLFKLRVRSIAEMQAMEESKRQRAPRRFKGPSL